MEAKKIKSESCKLVHKKRKRKKKTLYLIIYTLIFVLQLHITYSLLYTPFQIVF